MPRIRAALLIALLLAGCASTPDDDRRQAARAVLPRLDVHHQPPAPHPGASGDSDAAAGALSYFGLGVPTGIELEPRGDVGTVAADAVIRLVEAEDLFVLDLQTTTEAAGATAASVRVQVLYGTGRGHPTDGTYRVELTSTHGSWTVVSVEAAP